MQSKNSALGALDSRSGFQPAGNDKSQCELFKWNQYQRQRQSWLLWIPGPAYGLPGMTVAGNSGNGRLETLANDVLLELSADEDEARLALFVVLPFALQIAVEDHVNALEDEAARLVLE